MLQLQQLWKCMPIKYGYDATKERFLGICFPICWRWKAYECNWSGTWFYFPKRFLDIVLSLLENVHVLYLIWRLDFSESCISMFFINQRLNRIMRWKQLQIGFYFFGIHVYNIEILSIHTQICKAFFWSSIIEHEIPIFESYYEKIRIIS